MTRKFQPLLQCIQSAIGENFTEAAQIADRWKAYRYVFLYCWKKSTKSTCAIHATIRMLLITMKTPKTGKQRQKVYLNFSKGCFCSYNKIHTMHASRPRGLRRCTIALNSLNDIRFAFRKLAGIPEKHPQHIKDAQYFQH